MKRRVAWLAGLAMAATPMLLAQASHGSFTGRALNGTSGAPMPLGSVVTATVAGTTVSTTVGTDGAFTFDVGHPEGPIELTIGHQGAEFSTVRAEGSTETVLTAYDVTDQDDELHVTSDTMTIVAGDEGTLEILQIIRVMNPTTLAVHSAEGALRMPLLLGAFDVSLGEQTWGRPTALPGGFSLPGPLLPGESPMGYVYKLRVPRSGLALERDVFYATQRVDLLLGEGLQMSASSGFVFEEEVTLAGKQYRRYRHSSPTPGAPLRASVTFSGGGGLSTATWLVPLLLVVALLALAIPRLRGRGAKPSRVTEQDRRRLLEEIARLDLQFEAEEIGDEEYQRRREQLKQRLEDMTAELASR